MKARYTALIADNGYVLVTTYEGQREITMGFQNIEDATGWVRENQQQKPQPRPLPPVAWIGQEACLK